ncbi:tetratricopeptide repeat protein [Ferrovum myxofaciens]|uniref:Tetratricopeptide repeat protein n=1 Tax=Ferrovum myxofaciens TaxID=416213 RepID=A0A9E6MY17_9PROT|nr:hypothetical protein [Ferrovum myxofaciens]QKE37931.2 MAG: hypothetical protein HO273_03615 [Ferrovum myxofaciens]QWY78359.1 MAG: hypothetical protein JZL65_04595 [Ferrovum myxofaciens]
MIPTWSWAVECNSTSVEKGENASAILQADCGLKNRQLTLDDYQKRNSRNSSLPPYHHDNPAILNEYAIRYWLPKGDLETAHILLARAVRLDPFNQKIRANLDQIDLLQNDVGKKLKAIAPESFEYSYTNLDAMPKSGASPQIHPLGGFADTDLSPNLWPTFNKQ